MGMFDKIFDAVGLNDEVEEEETLTQSEPSHSHSNFLGGKDQKSKVVPLAGAAGQNALRVVLVEPQSFNDCQIISDHLKAKRSVIINLEGIDVSTARRIIDFVGGTAYALDGSMQKAGGSIFVAVPAHVEISGDLLNFSQPKEVMSWMNEVNYDG